MSWKSGNGQAQNHSADSIDPKRTALEVIWNIECAHYLNARSHNSGPSGLEGVSGTSMKYMVLCFDHCFLDTTTR